MQTNTNTLEDRPATPQSDIDMAQTPQQELANGGKLDGRPSDSSSVQVSSSPSNYNYHPRSSHANENLGSGLRSGHSASLFQHAHGFSIHQPTMIGEINLSITGSTLNQPSPLPVIIQAWMEGHAMQGVEHHSEVRAPPPRCHDGTRLACIGEFRKWGTSSPVNQKFAWLVGPAGVGKSAVAQTLAEDYCQRSLLGASIFVPPHLSRQYPQTYSPRLPPGTSLWITISYRLAVDEPVYRDYLTERIGRDPTIVAQDPSHQFNALIEEPFGSRRIANLRRLVIIIDGVENYLGQEDQLQAITLILRFVQSYPSSPLLWFISSRPERHFHPLAKNYEQIIWKYPLTISDNGSDSAYEDVRTFMRSSFDNLIDIYDDRIAPLPWPNEEDFIFLINRIIRGFFLVASAVVHFVGNRTIEHPMHQLNLVLEAWEDQRQAETVSKALLLRPVYNVYANVLQTIPPKSWHTVKRILGFHLLPKGFGAWARDATSLWALCNILGIQQSDAYSSLAKLHSLVDVPQPRDAAIRPVRLYHRCFADFLLDENTFSSFHINLEEVLLDLWECHLRALQEVSTIAYRQSPDSSNISLVWPSLGLDGASAQTFQLKFWDTARVAFFHHILACPGQVCPYGVHIDVLNSIQGQYMLLRAFEVLDFRNLVDSCASPDIPYRFIAFVDWLLEGEHPLFESTSTHQKLELSQIHYYVVTLIDPNALSFEIRTTQYDHGGVITTFRAYTDQVPILPEGIERKKLFSARDEPAPFAHLSNSIKQRTSKVAAAIIAGSADVGQCLLLLGKPAEGVTVYYVLPLAKP